MILDKVIILTNNKRRHFFIWNSFAVGTLKPLIRYPINNQLIFNQAKNSED